MSNSHMPERSQVLHIAAEIFAERGFVATTEADLKAAMNLRQQDALARFMSKSDLARAIVETAFSGYPLMGSNSRQSELSGVARVVAISRSLAHSFATDILSQAAVRLLAESQHIDAKLPEPFVTWVSLVRNLFEEAAEAGELTPDLDLDSATWTFVSSFAGAKDVCFKLGKLPELPGHIDALLRYLLPGFGVQDVERLLPSGGLTPDAQ